MDIGYVYTLYVYYVCIEYIIYIIYILFLLHILYILYISMHMRIYLYYFSVYEVCKRHSGSPLWGVLLSLSSEAPASAADAANTRWEDA